MHLHLKDTQVVFTAELLPFSELLQQQSQEGDDLYLPMVEYACWQCLITFYQSQDYSPSRIQGLQLQKKVISNSLPYHLGDAHNYCLKNFYKDNTLDVFKVGKHLSMAYKLDFEDYKCFLLRVLAVYYWVPVEEKSIKKLEKESQYSQEELWTMYGDQQKENPGCFQRVTERCLVNIFHIVENDI